MRKIIMWNVVTVDGCFEGSMPWDLSFHELVFGEELEALSIEQLQEADMLIFGKNTYIGMADYWPKAVESDPEVAGLMNSIPKIVCSATLDEANWNNTTIVRDSIKELKRLKQDGDRPMYVFGSAMLAESMINADLIDEIRLCVAPVLLGNGRRLFGDNLESKKLELLESGPLKNGGIIVRYAVNHCS